MMNQSMYAALRLIWTHYLVHPNKVLHPLMLQEGREKLFNLTHNGFGSSRSRSKATENVNIRKSTLFTRQCNVIAGQRVWRAFQIMSWYRQLYGEKLLLHLTLHSKLLRQYNNRKFCLLLATSYIFKWERDGISDEELQRALSEMEMMKRLAEHAAKSDNSPSTPAPEGWEMFVNDKHLKVWRHFIKKYNLFEYRVHGTFRDTTPRAFYDTQMDLKFWCGWDPQTIEINVIDTDIMSNSEVIHWVYKYPFPMQPRDYCYVRRSMESTKMNKMVIRSRAVPHHKCPEGQKIVRVREYESQLVITPNTTFDENGFSFYLTYFDNPQAQVPNMCYNWIASSGVPDFVERLHEAAKVMQKSTKEGYRPHISVTSHPNELKKKVYRP